MTLFQELFFWYTNTPYYTYYARFSSELCRWVQKENEQKQDINQQGDNVKAKKKK